MRSACLAAALAASMVAATAGLPAQAASKAQIDAFDKQIFGRTIGKDRVHACYRRVYDAPHLASHPQQNVRTVTLLVASSTDEGADSHSYVFGLGFTFRKSGRHFETIGDCQSLSEDTPDGGNINVVNCGGDCDSGQIKVTLKNDKSVLVAIPDGVSLWKAGDELGKGGDESRRFGADDKLFRVDRAPLSDCISLGEDDKEKAEIRKGQ